MSYLAAGTAFALYAADKREEKRIEHLLEWIAASPYNFVRNGRNHTGKEARRHLLWKRFRNRRKIKTAEDFINKIANHSTVTGESYWVEYPDKTRRPLKEVLEEQRLTS